MSDLRTELFTKVLPKMKQLTELNNLTFDDPEQPEVPVPTAVAPSVKVSTVERIFNWIKEHPACSYSDVCSAFEGDVSQQYIASKLYALSSRGDLHKAVSSSTGLYIYSAAIDTYRKFDRTKALEKMKIAREQIGKEELSRRIQATARENKAQKQLSVETPVVTPAVQVTPVDLNTLSIVQARKLYDELKQIFGA